MFLMRANMLKTRKFLFTIIICSIIFLLNFRLLYAGKFQPVNWKLSDRFIGTDDNWVADCSLNKLNFKKNDEVMLNISLKTGVKEFKEYIENHEGIGVIVIAERIYDQDGRPNLINNNFMSTVLTPAGIPIEFFAEPAQNYYKEKGPYRSIFELTAFKEKGQIKLINDTAQIEFVLNK